MQGTQIALAKAATAATIAAALLAGCGKPADPVSQAAKKDVVAGVPAPGIAETKAIMEEAYIYGFPMVAAYKAMNEFNIDKSSSQYKAGFNQIWNDSKTFTPKDTAIPTPNSDTPYSMVQADLRAEPIVLCVPKVDKNRYYSVMLADLYTFNYGYIGSRATGSDAGCYLVAGPRWQGEKPEGIAKVFRSGTDFSLIIYRTQLFNAADIDNVKKIQAGYTVQTLSAFLKQPAPPAAPAIDFPKFVGDDPFKAEFPAYLDFLLQFAPEVPEEKALRARLASIGIGPGKKFDFKDLSVEHKAAVGLAIKEGFEKINQAADKIGKNINGWQVGAAQGDRDFFKGDWLLRAAGAKAGIYGNDAVEAMYPLTRRRCRRSAAGRIEAPLRAYLRQGRVAAGERLLVDHDVRRQEPVAGRQPDQPLPDQLADAAGHEEEPGRVADDLHPEGFAGQGQGSELAAGARRSDLPGDAPVLAKGDAAVDPAGRRGDLEPAGREAGELSPRRT